MKWFLNSVLVLNLIALSLIAHGAGLRMAVPKTAFQTATQASVQRALDLAQKDKNSEALAILENILNSKQTEIKKDKIIMAIGRVKYQSGDLEGAIKSYSDIPKNSDQWLTSLEEKAWAFIRQSKFEKALSLYHTLSASAFAPQVGPEAYLIGSYSSLRICDYKSVFEVFKDYKAKYKNIDTSKLTQTETKSISQVTRKLHIVEVEAIQRMNLKNHKEVAINQVKTDRTSDDISFRKEEETWLDEVTHYEVQSKGCPTDNTQVGKK